MSRIKDSIAYLFGLSSAETTPLITNRNTEALQTLSTAVIDHPVEPQNPAKSATASYAPNYLDRQTLKNFRFVCKNFSCAAEVFLFREVLLRRNAQGFNKLRLIAGHPRFSKFVQSLQYIATSLTIDDVPGKSKEWSKAFAGSMRWDRSPARRMRYQQSCMQLHTERLMQVCQHLTSAFSNLPSLKEVCFAWGEDYLAMTHCPISQLQQKVLEPQSSLDSNPETDLQFRTGQLLALLGAAHELLKPLTTIKILGLPCGVFEEPGQIPASMLSVTKACQCFALRIVHKQQWRKSSLAGILSEASYLHTLEISFEPEVLDCEIRTVGLSRVLKAGTRWPNLKRLKLQALRAHDIYLKALLTTHATTLKSLELADIDLQNHHIDKRVPDWVSAGSWVDIILFLQTSLRLEAVRLDGTLTNHSNEVWESLEPDELQGWPSAWRPSGGSWLKHRIEKYIVEGGASPFPTALEVQEAGGWE